jgi:hypothetical protein
VGPGDQSIAAIDSTCAMCGITRTAQCRRSSWPHRSPFAKSITDGTCPLYKQLFLVTGPKTLPTAHELVTFVRSAAGLEVLRQTGHRVI